MGNEEVDLVTVVNKSQEKRSLLQKYDIPVEHLSYEYISKCLNFKELERIVLILRSGEEGIFPDLIDHGEKFLAKLNPNSKVLRVEIPVVTRSMLEPEDRKIIDEDIEKWMNEMKGREKDLEEGKALTNSTLNIPQPEIRQNSETFSKKSSLNSKINDDDKSKKQKSIASCDYESWDKFDADAELDRIDLHDEMRNVDAKNEQEKQKEKYQEAKKLSKESIANKLTLTATELSVMAEQEKNIGNEAYRSKDYEEALIRYNSSIEINSNINAYNNRAITNIKLERYQEAVNDCNTVLSMEFDNVTALMRRGLALENLEKKSEALVDYQTILQIEPNNKIAIAAINKLRKPSDSKKVRMKIEEELNSVEMKTESDNMIVEKESMISKDELKKVNFQKSRISEICFCDRAPGSSQNPKPPPHYKSSYCLPLGSSNQRKERIISHSKSQHSYFSDIKINDSKPKLIIEELENNDHENQSKCSESKSLQTKRNFTKNENQIGADGDKNDCVLNKNQNNTERPKKCEKFDESKKEKLDVATKYEKSNIPILKTELDKKISVKEFDALSIGSPYEFLHIWQSLKNDDDLSLHAKLLRSLSPEDFETVIGNKLDGNMFSTILKSLEKHFCNVEDVRLIQRFITSLTKISRFSIVRLFMDSNDKKVLQNILKFIEEEISSADTSALRKAYNV